MTTQLNNGLSPQVPGYPGAPWPYPSGYPMPFYPAPPYWGCAIPVPWNMQWIPAPPNYHPASPGTCVASTSGPISPTLGKHSRAENGEEQMTKEDGHEKSLWAPKTLRIDDPDEAAKSSIWATLGINKNDRVVGGNGGGMFTSSFQSKGEDKKSLKEASPALQANPAALSRSINFQESS